MAKTIESQFSVGLAQFEKKLDQVRLKDAETKKFLRTVLRPVQRTAKALIPRPGYPGDDPEKKALRASLALVARDLTANSWWGAMGAKYPQAAHSHLVEGWRQERVKGAKGGRGPQSRQVTAKGMTTTEFIKPAWNRHKDEILREIKKYVGKSIEKGAK